MRSPRVVLALLVGVLVASVPVLLALGPDEETRAARASVPGPDAPPSALAVLGAWDARRAAAWDDGDPRALRRLYVPGSVSGRADLALLREYAARGLRVPDLTVQRAAVRVVAAAPERLALVVTDRVVTPAVLTSGARRVALPRDAWSTRRVVLRLVAGTWRVVEVRDRAGPDPTRPPR